MKKYLRIAACIITLLLCAFFVCSCESLDDMRARQGFYDEDGNVILNGVKYIRIEADILPSGYGRDVYITESDVPVLLAEKYGDWFMITEDKTYIYDYGYYCYCRDDKYNELAEKYGGSIEINRLSIEYIDEDFESGTYMLTKEEQGTIEALLENGEARGPEGNFLAIVDCDKYEAMYYYSEDGFFCDRKTVIYAYTSDGGYYLRQEMFESDDYYPVQCVVASVPEEYVPLFDKLTNLD